MSESEESAIDHLVDEALDGRAAAEACLLYTSDAADE